MSQFNYLMQQPSHVGSCGIFLSKNVSDRTWNSGQSGLAISVKLSVFLLVLE